MNGAMHHKRLLAAALLVSALPLAAHATVIATFDWVPISENPPQGQPSTASGTLQLTLSSFSLTTGSNPTNSPNFAPYFASGTATSADITGFSYTDANGQSVNLSNLTTESFQTSIWETSAVDTPATGAAAPSAPPPYYYLVSGFVLNGTTAQGTGFKIANSAGTAGATFANGIGNGDNSFDLNGSDAAVTDGGYWELVNVTPVPLPSGLPLLLAGLGACAWALRRRSATLAAPCGFSKASQSGWEA
jgi:hypothetical protein